MEIVGTTPVGAAQGHAIVEKLSIRETVARGECRLVPAAGQPVLQNHRTKGTRRGHQTESASYRQPSRLFFDGMPRPFSAGVPVSASLDEQRRRRMIASEPNRRPQADRIEVVDVFGEEPRHSRNGCIDDVVGLCADQLHDGFVEAERIRDVGGGLGVTLEG